MKRLRRWLAGYDVLHDEYSAGWTDACEGRVKTLSEYIEAAPTLAEKKRRFEASTQPWTEQVPHD